MLQRVSGALNWMMTGKVPDWFGPAQPLQAIAPREAVEGRTRDFPVALNMSYTPKSNDAARSTFEELRLLSDAYDILRLVIETRKDQIGRFRWTVTREDGSIDDTAKRIEKHLRFPDGRNPFHTWLRLLMEDVLVVDAPTLYVNRSGKIPVFEVIDGTTIKPLIDHTGRPPQAPSPAFQSILKGVPALNYTSDEIIYRPRNPRPHKGYGFSPVEQILVTINIGLRRTVQQLEFFRSGSLPEALVGTPDTWNPDQIKFLQDVFDARMSGNLAARAGVTFVPGGTDIHQFKTDAILKNEFDEWIARIVCFAFSIPAAPFVREMNRATAESAAEQAKEEGLEPLLLWAKSLLDELIQRHLGMDGYVFAWDMAAMEDPKKRIERVVALKTAGIISVEKAQQMLDIEAHPVEAMPAGNGPVEKLAKADDATPSDEFPMSPEEVALSGAVSPFLHAAMVKAVSGADAALTKGKALPAELMSAKDRKRFAKAVAPGIKASALRGVSDGAAELAGKADGLPNPLDVETPAAQWAKQRSAWMVGMKWVDGILQENPNATYRIDDVMRDALRAKVSQAVEGGWTSVKLAESIRAHEAFSVARANNIARTEIAEAQQEGSMVYYRASGVVDRKIWSTARGGDTCPRCKSAEAEGPIPLEATFVSTGTQHAPGHSHCVPEGSRVLWGGRVVGATKALYSGPVVEFGTDLGHLAAVTVNHPVLTARGWIPAHALSEGDYLVSPNFGERMPDADPDNKQLETMIEDAFASCVVSSLMTPKSVVVSPEDFHGDAKGFQGDVEIVNPDGLLLSDVHPSGADEVSQNILTLVGEGLGLLARDSEILGHFVRALLSSDLSVERANELASSLWSESVKADLVRLRNSSALNALLYKDSRDYVAADSKLLGDLLFWLSRHVSAANVISVEVRDFIGHVYDLQVTSGSMYTCNGIYIHNCRCVALPVLKEETA